MNDILLGMTAHLLEKPETLKCTSEDNGGAVVMTLSPKFKEDIPRLIGKKGATITAIRTIIRAINNARGNTGQIIIKVSDTPYCNQN